MPSRFMAAFSFIYILVVLSCTVSSLLSHDEECLALFEFKQTSFFHDSHGFQKFNSWRKSNTSGDNGYDCCLWDGVACSGEGHVIGLDLSESFLRGRISSNSSLFNLFHLQMLNLSMNDFVESQIPSKIARLRQLRILDLSYSKFSGHIPNEISHLVHISFLDLSGNPLTLRSPSFEYLLQNLTRLEELDLSGVDISSSIPHLLANFSSLRSLDLEDCHLRDEFPTEIFHLPKLNYLSMRYNPNLIGSLPEFRNNTLLNHLRLYSTGFYGTIPNSISNLNHLVVLSLSECRFTGHIPGSLSNLTQLTILGLAGNDFNKGPLPNFISKLTNLNELLLNRMNIYDEILPSLANLTNLFVLGMAQNFIFGQIPPSFMNLTQLIVVNLGANQLQGPISNSFSNFKSLKNLHLENNNFSGNVDLDMFLRLDKLEGLFLGRNRISVVTSNNYTKETLPELKYIGLGSCNLKEVPSFLRFQKKMMGLFLSDNKIEGLIPEWLSDNSQKTLQMLDLSLNFITGFHRYPLYLPWSDLKVFLIEYNQLGWLPIPPKTMVYYDVSDNNMTGEIPSLICEVKSLKVLDLSSNKMTGILPPCLGNLSNSLLVLDLKRNNFSGPMMNTFTVGSVLKHLDLSENRFIGKVSKSLKNCTNLEVLSLGDNSFDGRFPFWLKTFSQLQVLILRSNKFYGAIQDPIVTRSHFSKLRIIDLSNNGFGGQLPKKVFKSWNAMKATYVGKSFAMNLDLGFDQFNQIYPYSMSLTNKGVKREYERILNIFTAIDLSCNNFEGQLPQSLQDLKGLQSLNLSNNHLSGHVLPSLRNLKNLESLDLSQNELVGEIPQELLQLGFLAILNVSFNNLNGRIPQGRQFNTFENNSYKGNPGLCGEPLSKECRISKTSTLPPTSNESESLLPSETIDWIVIFIGVAGGLVIGTIIGNILYARYSDWFIDRSEMKNKRWVRPLTNTRRI